MDVKKGGNEIFFVFDQLNTSLLFVVQLKLAIWIRWFYRFFPKANKPVLTKQKQKSITLHI